MRVEATIDRFEGDKAVLKLNTGETIIWPKALFSSELREGAVINIQINPDNKTTEDKQSQAKEILNEILNPKEE